MHSLRSFLFYWFPVFAWMFLIFGFSGDSASFQRSSRIIGPLMHWLFPRMPDTDVNHVVFLVRKCAHLSEYAVLAMLVWRARRRHSRITAHSWPWPAAAEALWIAVLYAATDELHQTFVPSREGCLRDVFIDSSGAVAGLLVLWLVGRWRKLW